MKNIDSILAIAFITSAMLLSCSSENTDLPINPDKQVGAEYSEYKATIEPGRKFGRTTKYFLYDIKGAPGAFPDAKAAEIFFATDKMSGLRIPIYGDVANGGHQSQGNIGEKTYAKVLKTIRSAQEAAGDRDLLIMASKKLKGKESFPSWVMDKDGVNVEKYSLMLMDYLRYMKSEGIEVDVLGIDNEINFNEGNITPEKYKKIVDNVRKMTAEEGIKVPLMIGHERYNPEQNFETSWIKKLFDSGWSDRLDIYGTHYYPHHHVEKFRKALSREVGLVNSDKNREFWATEPHWDNDEEAKADFIYHSGLAMCTIFDQTDLGMDAFCWWGYKSDGTFRHTLMKDLSLAIFSSTPIKVTDHDGEDTLDMNKLQTRAFMRGNEIHLFIINVTPVDKPSLAKTFNNYLFYLSGYELSSGVSGKIWRDDYKLEGTPTSVKVKEDGRQFSLAIPSRSITHLQFKIK